VCSSSFRSISIDVDRAVDSASVPLGSKKKYMEDIYLVELASSSHNVVSVGEIIITKQRFVTFKWGSFFR
jgi:hypothetical protein